MEPAGAEEQPRQGSMCSVSSVAIDVLFTPVKLLSVSSVAIDVLFTPVKLLKPQPDLRQSK